MSSKRTALNQLTKDGWSRDESPRGDDEPDPVVMASADVMAKRKLAKPRARRQAAESNGSAFGSTTTSTSNAPSNPFASFGSSAPVATQPAASNPFASIGSFGAKPAQPQVASQIATPTSSLSSTQDKKPTQLRALNEKFVDTVNELLKKSGNEDWTVSVKKYLEYADKIKNGTLEPSENAKVAKPEETATAKPASSAFSFSTPSQPAAAASTGFSFGSGNAKPAASSAFSFGSSQKQSAPEKTVEEKKPEETKVHVEVSDSDSDSDGPPKGPKFQLDTVPTTSDSPFAFNNKPKSSEDSGKTGFQFSGTLSKSENPFKFKSTESQSKPAPGKESKPAESKTDQNSTSTPSPFSFSAPKTDEPKPAPSSGFAFGSQPSSTWTPDKGIKFADSKSSNFTFGGSKEEKTEIPKVPTFSFSTSKPAETSTEPSTSTSTTASSSKPGLFSFSGSTAAPFSFGAKPADSSSEEKKTDGAKFAFGSGGAFGQGSSLFGNKPAAATVATTAPFSFSAPSAPAAKKEGDDENGGDDEEASAPAEPSKDFSSEKGPGEEEEDVAFEHKAKLFKLVNGKFEVQGLGQLRVLTHKQTNKTRLLLRAEGSGRVILNIPVRKEIEYKKEGKNQVRLVDFDAETKKPVTYLARVKTSDDAENLKNALETEKVKE